MKYISCILILFFSFSCQQSKKEDPKLNPEHLMHYLQNDTLHSNGLHYPKPVDANTIIWPKYSKPLKEPEIYLASFLDTITGSKITRVGDQTAFKTKGSHVGHNYASNAVWNNDGTLLKLNMSPARILSDTDYSVKYIREIPYQAQWSNTYPNLMYGIANGNQFITHDVVTNTNRVLHTFENYSNLSIGDGEGSQDRSDKFICFFGNQSDTKYIIVYNIQSNEIIATKKIEGNTKELGSAQVSPLGNYIVLAWNTNGSGPQQGYKAYDINLSNERHLYDETQHFDIGIDVNGDEVIVAIGDQLTWEINHYLVMVRLKDGFAQPLFKDEPPGQKGIWGGHVSCRNTQRDGWAYISEALASDDVATNELFAVKLDYSNDNLIERYGKHHSNRMIGYNHEARATVNPNGTKICFDSNWYDPKLEAWKFAPAWVLEYPQ